MKAYDPMWFKMFNWQAIQHINSHHNVTSNRIVFNRLIDLVKKKCLDTNKFLVSTDLAGDKVSCMDLIYYDKFRIGIFSFMRKLEDKWFALYRRMGILQLATPFPGFPNIFQHLQGTGWDCIEIFSIYLDVHRHTRTIQDKAIYLFDKHEHSPPHLQTETLTALLKSVTSTALKDKCSRCMGAP